ncbi:MAG TPA: hypothetical protein VK808_10190, partial [Bacteroidia bacterium]|nr:hypothetical protein [Bacteroidia bacterium]
MVKTIQKFCLYYFSPRLKPWAIVFLLFNSITVFAGGTVKVKGHKFIILPFVSTIWQRSFFGEFELGHVYDIHFVNHKFGRTFLAYSKIGAEGNLDFKHELWAPKFSSEAELGYICLRANVEDYIQQGRTSFYVTPEAGLTLAGFITVVCGYNKCVSQTGFSAIKTLRISA